jgi:hypothetical protein
MMSKLIGATAILAMLGALGATQPATAQENVIQRMMEGAGLTSSRGRDIDYRERAPLVVPPKQGELPAPQAQSAAKADPSWPTDPDAERRRKQLEEDNVPAGKDYKSYLNRNNPWISPDELRSNRRAGAGIGPADATNRDGRTVVSPDELRRGNPALRGQTTADGEPVRRRLTDPPPGYRTAVPETSAGQTAATAEPEPRRGFFSRINPFKN